jgi:hypothetical protein
MNVYLLAGVICLVGWLALAFVAAIPSGWVHTLLAAGCVLVARGLVSTPRR